ncbi:hypothetical protein EX30DRAFT_339892 [Ascodesmis nigricans]|uniref:Uncharacterized protein n=1 Tax=Ascodesmis nigricans TaxID=341454 RepID=A0A4S2N0X1_9PEZI|nr:hypothetical protein EX30DRAFT_339892 [Ascodesmis nigricans]
MPEQIASPFPFHAGPLRLEDLPEAGIPALSFSIKPSCYSRPPLIDWTSRIRPPDSNGALRITALHLLRQLIFRTFAANVLLNEITPLHAGLNGQFAFVSSPFAESRIGKPNSSRRPDDFRAWLPSELEALIRDLDSGKVLVMKDDSFDEQYGAPVDGKATQKIINEITTTAATVPVMVPSMISAPVETDEALRSIERFNLASTLRRAMSVSMATPPNFSDTTDQNSMPRRAVSASLSGHEPPPIESHLGKTSYTFGTKDTDCDIRLDPEELLALINASNVVTATAPVVIPQMV